MIAENSRKIITSEKLKHALRQDSFNEQESLSKTGLQSGGPYSSRGLEAGASRHVLDSRNTKLPTGRTALLRLWGSQMSKGAPLVFLGLSRLRKAGRAALTRASEPQSWPGLLPADLTLYSAPVQSKNDHPNASPDAAAAVRANAGGQRGPHSLRQPLHPTLPRVRW